MAVATIGYQTVRDLFTSSYDGMDVLGSAKTMWFALAETITHETDLTVPESWQFRDSPLHGKDYKSDDWPDSELAELLAEGYTTPQDLVSFGNVITRYATLLKAADKDY